MKKILLFSISLFSFLNLFGQAGTLDTSFANAGIGTYAPGTLHDVVYGIVPLPDNSMLIAGTAKINNMSGSVIMHVLQDGTVDTAYGNNGKALVQYGMECYAYGMDLQPDGKCVVTGLTYTSLVNGDIFILRLNEDGTLDSTFSGNGYDIKSFGGGEDLGKCVSVLSSGKILVGGQGTFSGSSEALFLMYNSDGTVDTTFNNNTGYLAVSASGDVDQINGIAELADGSIAAAGYNTNGTSTRAITMSISATGNLIGGFTYVPTATTTSRAYGIIADGNRWYMTGTSDDFNGTDTWIARYNISGPDVTFNGTGIVTINPAVLDAGFGIVLQPNGKILVAGTTGTGIFDRDFMTVRFDSTGTVDNTFGTNGYAITPFGAFADANAVCLSANGKVLSAGFRAGTNNDMIICRYLNDINSSTGLLSPLNYPLLSVFPNPAGSSEEIRISGLKAGDYNLSCYDANGREIFADNFSASANELRLTTAGWNQGLYILRLVDRNTFSVRTARVVIQ
jgi:uncharacterized delta-60 repeat protein